MTLVDGLITGLRVPKAIGDFLILDAIRDSQGIALAVSDQEMIEAARTVGAAEGLFVAPEGAACFVALKKLRQSGWVQASESAVIFNTGAGSKYLECYAALASCNTGN